MKEISIDTDYIKLDSFLKFAGETVTGAEAKELVLQGDVKVDGEICLMRGKKLKNGNVISVNNHEYRITQK